MLYKGDRNPMPPFFDKFRRRSAEPCGFQYISNSAPPTCSSLERQHGQLQSEKHCGLPLSGRLGPCLYSAGKAHDWWGDTADHGLAAVFRWASQFQHCSSFFSPSISYVFRFNFHWGSQYRVTLFPFKMAAFKADSQGPLVEEPVKIGNIYAVGPRARPMLPPPARNEFDFPLSLFGN